MRVTHKFRKNWATTNQIIPWYIKSSKWMKDLAFVVLFISKDVFFFPLVKDKAVQWWIYIIYTIYSPKLISLKGLITRTLQWKRLHCLHLMEAFITKNNLLFILGKYKKFKICSRRNNKMQCLCSNAPLHIKPKQNFYCAPFFPWQV